MSEFIVVATFDDVLAFDQACVYLEGNGITCRGENVNASIARPHAAAASGGFRLLVNKKDLSAAKEALHLRQGAWEEVNHALRVRRSKLAVLLGTCTGLLVGGALWIVQNDTDPAFAVALVTAFGSFLLLTKLLVPPAILREKPASQFEDSRPT